MKFLMFFGNVVITFCLLGIEQNESFYGILIPWANTTSGEILALNPLSANPTKWSNALKQFVGDLPTHFLCVFDHFVRLVLKGLRWNLKCSQSITNYMTLWFAISRDPLIFACWKRRGGGGRYRHFHLRWMWSYLSK